MHPPMENTIQERFCDAPFIINTGAYLVLDKYRPPSQCVVALYEANGARQCSNVKLNCTAL